MQGTKTTPAEQAKKLNCENLKSVAMFSGLDRRTLETYFTTKPDLFVLLCKHYARISVGQKTTVTSENIDDCQLQDLANYAGLSISALETWHANKPVIFTALYRNYQKRVELKRETAAVVAKHWGCKSLKDACEFSGVSRRTLETQLKTKPRLFDVICIAAAEL